MSKFQAIATDLQAKKLNNSFERSKELIKARFTQLFDAKQQEILLTLVTKLSGKRGILSAFFKICGGFVNIFDGSENADGRVYPCLLVNLVESDELLAAYSREIDHLIYKTVDELIQDIEKDIDGYTVLFSGSNAANVFGIIRASVLADCEKNNWTLSTAVVDVATLLDSI